MTDKKYVENFELVNIIIYQCKFCGKRIDTAGGAKTHNKNSNCSDRQKWIKDNELSQTDKNL